MAFFDEEDIAAPPQPVAAPVAASPTASPAAGFFDASDLVTPHALAKDDKYDPVSAGSQADMAGDPTARDMAFQAFRERYHSPAPFSPKKAAEATGNAFKGIWGAVKGAGKIAENTKTLAQDYAQDAAAGIKNLATGQSDLSTYDRNETEERNAASEILASTTNAAKGVAVDLPYAVGRNLLDLKNWATGTKLTDDELRQRFDRMVALHGASEEINRTGGLPGVTAGPEQRAQEDLPLTGQETPEQKAALLAGRQTEAGEITQDVGEQTGAAGFAMLPMSAVNNPVTRGAAGAALRVVGKGLEATGGVAKHAAGAGTLYGIFSHSPATVAGSVASKYVVPAAGRLMTEAGDSMFTGEQIAGNSLRQLGGKALQAGATGGVLGTAFALGADSPEQAVGDVLGGVATAPIFMGDHIEAGQSRPQAMSARATARTAAARFDDLRNFGAELPRSTPGHEEGMSILPKSEQDRINLMQGFLAGQKNVAGGQLEVSVLPEAEYDALPGSQSGTRGFVGGDGNIYLNAGMADAQGGVSRTAGHEMGHVSERLSEIIGGEIRETLKSSIKSKLYDPSGQPIPEFKKFINEYQQQLGGRINREQAESEFLAETTSKILENKGIEDFTQRPGIGEQIRQGASDAMKALGLAPKAKDGIFSWQEIPKITSGLRNVLREVGKGAIERAKAGTEELRNRPQPEEEGPAPAPVAQPAPEPAQSSPEEVNRAAAFKVVGLDSAEVDAAREKASREAVDAERLRRGKRPMSDKSANDVAEAGGRDFDEQLQRYVERLQSDDITHQDFAKTVAKMGGVQREGGSSLLEAIAANELGAGSARPPVPAPVEAGAGQLASVPEKPSMEPAPNGSAPQLESFGQSPSPESKPRLRIARDEAGNWFQRPQEGAPEGTGTGSSRPATPSEGVSGGHLPPEELSRRVEAAENAARTAEAAKKRKTPESREKATAQAVKEARIKALLDAAHETAPDASHLQRREENGATKYTGRIDESIPAHRALLDELGVDKGARSNIATLQDNLGKVVFVDYKSAAKEGQSEGAGLDVTGKQRAKEYKAESVGARIEDAKAGDKNVGVEQTKAFYPMGFKVNPSTGSVTATGFSPNRLLSNVGKIIDFLRAEKRATGYESAQDPEIIKDFNGLAQNHANGYKGDGSGPLAGETPTPGYEPYAIDGTRFELLNAAMANESAKTPKTNRGDAKANAEAAQQTARDNGGFVTEDGETNQLRDLINKSGRFTFQNEGGETRSGTKEILEPTIESLRVDPELMRKISTEAPEGEMSLRPSGVIDPSALTASGIPKYKPTAAGFMPGQGGEKGQLSEFSEEKDLTSIKSKIPKTDPLGFYSRLRQHVDEAPFGTSKAKTGQHWLGVIQKWAKGASTPTLGVRSKGIARDELEWSGIEEWLKSKGSQPIKKEEVLDFIDHNGIQLQEVQAGGVASKGDAYYMDDEFSDAGYAFDDHEGAWLLDAYASSDFFGDEHDGMDSKPLVAIFKPKSDIASNSDVYGDKDAPPEERYIAELDGEEIGRFGDVREAEKFLAEAIKKHEEEHSAGTKYEIWDASSNQPMRGESYDTLEEAKTRGREIAREMLQSINEDHSEDGEAGGTQFSGYKLEGGTNYKEIRLALPIKESMDSLPEGYHIEPFIPKSQSSPSHYIMRNAEGRAITQGDTEQEAIAKAVKYLTEGGIDKHLMRAPNFTESHWDEPNVVAHFRQQDYEGMVRPAEEGIQKFMDRGGNRETEKVRHIDEFQSDWHQKGRERGYASDKPSEEESALRSKLEDIEKRRTEFLQSKGFESGGDMNLVLRKLQDKYGEENNHGAVSGQDVMDDMGMPEAGRSEFWRNLSEGKRRTLTEEYREKHLPKPLELKELESIAERHGEFRQEQSEVQSQLNKFTSRPKVPDAPFKKSWAQLAFKRALKLAVEDGMDRMSWSTGDQNIEHYKQALVAEVQKVTWDHPPDREFKMVTLSTVHGGYMKFDVSPEGVISNSGGSRVAEQFEGKDLADVIGKDNAKKILQPGEGEMDGEGMEVGGEGMRTFYDEMVPQFAKKYVEKWGSKVEDVALPNGETVHSVKITPQMRAAVEQGQPMFMPGGRGKEEPSIKSKVGQLEDFGAQDEHGFYSGLQRAIKAKIPNKASGDQILATLKGAGVKQEEMDNMGLAEFLKTHEGPLSKEKLQEFVKAGGVQFKEVTKGDVPERVIREQEARDNEITEKISELNRAIADATDGEVTTRDLVRLSDGAVSDALEGYPEAQKIWSERLKLVDQREADREARKVNSEGRDPKFAQYQLPGGENYKEVLMTLPEGAESDTPQKVRHPTKDGWALKYPNGDYVVSKNGGASTDRTSDPDKASLWDKEEYVTHGIRAHDKDQFRSSHWDEPNVLVHTRQADHVDTDGNKVRLIEEIQSDWHQKGRREGYSGKLTEADLPEGFTIEKSEDGTWSVRQNDGALFNWNSDKQTAIRDAVRARKGGGDGVPDAPFKKTWAELAFKRALRMAVEDGMDKIAWTPGEQQAERYDLSKSVDDITYRKKGDQYQVVAGKDGSIVADQTVTADKLPDLIGKEMAQKIVNGEGRDEMGNTGGKVLSGLDLKVGGEGMKGFYDKILPDFVRKYVKKWGGKVETTTLPVKVDEHGANVGDGITNVIDDNGNVRATYEHPDPETRRKLAQRWIDSNPQYNNLRLEDSIHGGEQVHSVTITPEMREAIMEEGQSMFMPGGGKDPTSIKSKIDTDNLEWAQPKRAANAGDVVVNVKVSDFDKAFQKDHGFYIDDKGNGEIKGRRERFQEFLQEGKPVEMPEVVITKEGTAAFVNGRHRFSVVRDGGAKTIPVSMDEQSAMRAHTLGMVADQTKGQLSDFMPGDYSGVSKTEVKESSVDEQKARRARLMADMQAQSSWLTDRAKEKGFKSVDDLSEEDPAAFGALAKQWRDEHPRFDAAGSQLFMPGDAVEKPDRNYTIRRLPRDMREDLFNNHATQIDGDATESEFYAKRVPSGWLNIDGIKVDEIPGDQLGPYVKDFNKLPPVVIADEKLIDGQHRIQAARKKGETQIRYIDVSGLVDTDPNSGGFISELPKSTKFMPSEKPEEKNLVAVHNLSIGNLKHAIKVGGLAVPSIAIIRADKSAFDGFGDVTLVAHPDLIDPQKNKAAKTFNADVYSPRYPKVTTFFKDGDAKKIEESLKGYREELPAGWSNSVDTLIDTIKDKGFSDAQYNKLAQYAYARDKGLIEDPKGKLGYTDKLWEITKDHSDEIGDWLRDRVESLGVKPIEKIFQGYTNMGNRRYKPHDLDTVIKIMKKELRGGEGFNYGVGSIRAKVAKQFKALEAIKKSRDSVVTKEEMEMLKKEIDEEFSELETEASDSRKEEGSMDSFSDDMIALAEGGSENMRHLREMYPNGVPQGMRDFLEKLKHLPTEYFETKVQRAVQLQEFGGAAVPDGTPKDVIDRLKKSGLSVETYQRGDAESRKAAVAKLSEETGSAFMPGQSSEVEAGDSPRRTWFERGGRRVYHHRSQAGKFSTKPDLANFGRAAISPKKDDDAKAQLSSFE